MEKKTKYCEICGVSNKTKIVSFDSKSKMTLCQKHRCQFKNHNKFFDTSQITCKDLNEIIVKDNDAYIQLYNQYGIKIQETKIDLEDIKICKNKRWRTSKKSNKIYVISGSKSNQVYLARFLLNYYGDLEVDHIDGDSLNNKKSNLRIVSRKENLMNLSPCCNSQFGIRGVRYYDKIDKYTIDYTHNKNRFYFKSFKKAEQAVYLRYLCETFFNKKFRYSSNDNLIFKYIDKLSNEDKKEIEKYFKKKVGEHSYDY